MKNFFSCFISFCFISFCFSQSNSSIDFQNSEGKSTITIPLFDYSFGNTIIPVSITYSSNGLLYDDNSLVGSGWSINNLDFFYEQNIRGRDDFFSIIPNLDSVKNVINNLIYPLNLNSAKYERDIMLTNFVSGILGEVSEFPNSSLSSPNISWDNNYDIFSFKMFSDNPRFIYKNRKTPLNTIFQNTVTNHNNNVLFLNNYPSKYKIKSFNSSYISILDDMGNSYYYDGEPVEIIHGTNVYNRKRYLNQVINNNGEKIEFEYEPSYLSSSSDNKLISITEGYVINANNRINTNISLISNTNNYTEKRVLTKKIVTPSMSIHINYYTHNNHPLISSILILSKTNVVVKRIVFEYILAPKYAYLKGVHDYLPDFTTTFDYYNENELTFTSFDKSIDGYIYFPSQAESNSKLFFDEIKTLPIYHVDFNMNPGYYAQMNSISNLYLNQNIKYGNKENMLPISEGGRIGLIKHIHYPNKVTDTFKYSYASPFNKGTILTETYTTTPKDLNYNSSTLAELDTIQHKMYVYGEIDINDIRFQDFYTYNPYNTPLYGSWTSNSFTKDELKRRSNFIKESGTIINLLEGNAYNWKFIRNFQINDDQFLHPDLRKIAPINYYYTQIKEISFIKNKPIQVNEYLFDKGDMDLNIEYINSRNISMNVAGQGIVNRVVKPIEISKIFPSDGPMLKQNNIYELSNNIWRIKKRAYYTYRPTQHNLALTELHISDFAKINKSNLTGSRPKEQIYQQTNIDSFFDYSFYSVDYRSRMLNTEKIVEYHYNH